MKKLRYLVFLAAMVLLLTGCGGKEENTETTEAPVTDGVSVTYYHGNDWGSVVPETTLIPKLTAQALLDLLAEQKVIPEGTTVRNFKLTEGIINLDLSKEFETEAKNLGSFKEQIMLGALVNTFLDAYDAEGLELTTEGRILKTGFHVYDDILTFTK